MKKWRNSMLAAVFAACVGGSFVMTYAWQAPPVRRGADAEPSQPDQILGRWLRLMPEQARQIAGVDPTFAEESARLQERLEAEREKLADLFEQADATDEAIMEQVEVVIEIHDRLERRVARHLLALRPHLNEQQRSKLFRRCARGIRESGHRGWRHGRGGGPGGGGGRGRGGHGGAMGAGGGNGNHAGMGGGGGQGRGRGGADGFRGRGEHGESCQGRADDGCRERGDQRGTGGEDGLRRRGGQRKGAVDDGCRERGGRRGGEDGFRQRHGQGRAGRGDGFRRDGKRCEQDAGDGRLERGNRSRAGAGRGQGYHRGNNGRGRR